VGWQKFNLLSGLRRTVRSGIRFVHPSHASFISWSWSLEVLWFPVARKEGDAIVLSRKGNEEVMSWAFMYAIFHLYACCSGVGNIGHNYWYIWWL